MNDRELLELAAEAAGVKIDKSPYGGGGRGNTGFDVMGNAVLDWHNNVRWNPLTDDGDALRLAIKLDLSIRPHTWGVGWIDVGHIKELTGGDPMAATRRAIVRAAAEIGKRVDAQPESVG